LTSRRSWITAALVGAAVISIPAHAQVPSWSLEAQRRLMAGGAGDVARDLRERQRLVDEGESALSAGDAIAAQQAFDRAALMVHSPDVEMGLVRTYMQSGHYRRALAFGAHTAGAHRNVPAGAALYSWLLHIGGQGVVARRYLDDALAAAPEDAALKRVRELIGKPQAQPDGVLLMPPLQAAPYAWPAAPAQATPAMAETAVVGSALLLSDGSVAVAPASSVRDLREVWLRNGMGQTVAAAVVAADADATLVLLRLASAMPTVPSMRTALREPYAGSPAYMIEYVAGTGTAAAWPLLQQGFFGRALAAPGDRLLGIDVVPGPRGGPVFDAQGRLAGLAVPGADGRDRLVAIDAVLRMVALTPAPGTEVPAAVARMPLDELYEQGLRVSLQMLGIRR